MNSHIQINNHSKYPHWKNFGSKKITQITQITFCAPTMVSLRSIHDAAYHPKNPCMLFENATLFYFYSICSDLKEIQCLI